MLSGLLLASFSTMAQSENTIIIKKEPRQGQTIIEIKDGNITVDGKVVSTYPKSNKETGKKIIIDAANDAPTAMDWSGAIGESRPMLGVRTQKDETPGALVIDVAPGSAAEKAGLQPEDRIIAINETGIASPEDLVAEIGRHKAGDEVAVRYRRKEQTSTTKAILQSSPQASSQGYPFHPFGGGQGQMPNMMPYGQMPDISMEDLQNLLEQFQTGQATGPKLGIMAEERVSGDGVLITGVTPGSAADKAGLKAGDILTHWNGNTITNISMLQGFVNGAAAGKSFDVRYLRHGKAQTAKVKFDAPKRRAEL